MSTEPRGNTPADNRPAGATAEMWFDPACPWTWITSRWLLEVERVRDMQVRFRVMSLALLNGNVDMPEADAAALRETWGPVRVMAATELSCGAQAVRDLYSAIGELIHIRRAPTNRDLYAAALTSAGLPHTLANAAETTAYDEAVRASHAAGMGPVEGAGGCPVIHLHTSSGELFACFGPVVSPHPRGEAAGKLWDAMNLVANTAGFYELKRARNTLPVFD